MLDNESSSALAVKDAVFTPNELIALNNGIDRCGLFVDGGIAILGLSGLKDSIPEVRSHLVSRFLASGLVDEDGCPSPELKRVLDPLMQPCLTITDALRPEKPFDKDDRTGGVYVLDDGTGTVARRAPGYLNEWNLCSIDSFGNTSEALAWAFGIREYRSSDFPGRTELSAPELEGLFGALAGADVEKLNSIASRHGLPSDGLMDLSGSFQVDAREWPAIFELRVSDYRDCEPAFSEGLQLADYSTGVWRSGTLTLIPEKGFLSKRLELPLPDDGEDYWRADGGVPPTCSIEFMGDENFGDRVLDMPKFRSLSA